jgi:hypothetical protein
MVRFMDYLRLKKSIRQICIVIFLLIGILVGIQTLLHPHEPMSLSVLISRPLHSFADLKSLIPVEFIVIITVIIGFWRGITIAQEHIGPSSVMDHFWVGIVMYVTFILLNTIVTGETPGDFFYVFLFAALIAMCAARLTVVGMVRGGKENEFNRSWFLGIILAALFVVSVSSLLGSMIGEHFTGIGVVILGLFGSVLVLLWILISPIISLSITILSYIFHNSDILEKLGENFKNLNEMLSGFGRRVFGMVETSGIGILISRWGPTVKTIILGTIIVLAILGLVSWMAIKLWRDRERSKIGDEQKANIKGGNIFQLLLGILRQSWSGAINTLENLTDFKHRQRVRAAARIRQVYAELMELCESLGQPRAEAQTPLEYVPNLVTLFPEAPSEVEVITVAYLDVRYGQIPETQKEIEEVEAAWKKIHAEGRELLSKLKHERNK